MRIATILLAVCLLLFAAGPAPACGISAGAFFSFGTPALAPAFSTVGFAPAFAPIGFAPTFVASPAFVNVNVGRGFGPAFANVNVVARQGLFGRTVVRTRTVIR